MCLPSAIIKAFLLPCLAAAIHALLAQTGLRRRPDLSLHLTNVSACFALGPRSHNLFYAYVGEKIRAGCFQRDWKFCSAGRYVSINHSGCCLIENLLRTWRRRMRAEREVVKAKIAAASGKSSRSVGPLRLTWLGGWVREDLSKHSSSPARA